MYSQESYTPLEFVSTMKSISFVLHKSDRYYVQLFMCLWMGSSTFFAGKVCFYVFMFLEAVPVYNGLRGFLCTYAEFPDIKHTLCYSCV